MNTTQALGLSKSEYELLISVQAYLTRENISATEEKSMISKKNNWLKKWESLLLESEIVSADCFKKKNFSPLITDFKEVSNFKKRIILFEALLFEPFFELGVRSLAGLGKSAFDETERKDNLEKLYTLGSEIGVKKKELLDSLGVFEKSISSVTPSRLFQRVSITIAAAIALSVTAGLAAPAIGTVIGGLLGLSGAAATSAGLALLGGGALSVGGLGMLGGTVVIIGGGGILGAITGNSIHSNLISHPKLLVREAAKLLTILKSFSSSLGKQSQIEFVEEVLRLVRTQKSQISSELDILSTKNQRTKKMNQRKDHLEEAQKIYSNLFTECAEYFSNL